MLLCQRPLPVSGLLGTHRLLCACPCVLRRFLLSAEMIDMNPDCQTVCPVLSWNVICFHQAMVSCHMLSELEEVIQYKLVPERREIIRQIWWERLQVSWWGAPRTHPLLSWFFLAQASPLLRGCLTFKAEHPKVFPLSFYL